MNPLRKYLRSCCCRACGALMLGVFLVGARANDDVVVKKLYELKFDKFTLSVAAPLDKSEYTSSAESVGDGGSWVESWTSKNCFVVAFENSVIVNGLHFDVPDKSLTAWYISDNIFVPEVGLIRPSPIPESVKVALNHRYEDFEIVHGGIKFIMKKCFFSSASYEIEKNRFDVVIGDVYLIIENGSLLYKDKDYGKVRPGDIVKVSEDRQLTVVPK